MKKIYYCDIIIASDCLNAPLLGLNESIFFRRVPSSVVLVYRLTSEEVIMHLISTKRPLYILALINGS